MGGNRSGKTEWAAKEVIKTLYSKPGAVVWCFPNNGAELH
jgi:adenosyl cobinamide kinase/adenosyl cobinamide phosphate guanylyltransferase